MKKNGYSGKSANQTKKNHIALMNLINFKKLFNDWKEVVVEKQNEFDDIGHTAKFPALYLFGSTIFGKTYFINFINSNVSKASR